MVPTDGDCQNFPLKIKVVLTVHSPVVPVGITRRRAQRFDFLPTQSVYVLHMEIMTDSVYFCIHH